MATQISQLINQMVKDRQLTPREPWRWSWGNKIQCRALFEHIFRNIDSTISGYQHLPEYDLIIDWMTDTADKGLMLMGDCGRGKSVILSYVLPVLFRMRNRIFVTRYTHKISARKFRTNKPTMVSVRQHTSTDCLTRHSLPLTNWV